MLYRLYNFFARRSEDTRIFSICLLVSTGIWGFLHLQAQQAKYISRPIKFEIPQGWSAKELLPTHFEGRMSCSNIRYFLLQQRLTNDTIYLTLTGTAQQNISAKKIVGLLKTGYTSSVEITATDPAGGITLFLEPSVERYLPVQGTVLATYKKGFSRAGQVTLDPVQVLVRGPAAMVNSLQFLVCDTLKLNDISKKTITQVPILMQDARLSCAQPSVKLTLDVVETTEKVLLVPVRMMPKNLKSQCYPERVQVRCLVPLSRYDEVKVSDFDVVVQLKDSASNNFSLPVFLREQSPWCIGAPKIYPDEVQFSISND